MFLTIALITAVTGLPATDSTQRWPSFQNGGRTELTSDKLPLEWSPEQGVAWIVALDGYGQSTPVVWNGQIYVTYCRGEMKDKMVIQALRQTSGETLWKHEVTNSTPEKNSTYVSRAAPTPVADANGVITFFEGGNLVALKHDGVPRWERDLVKVHGKISARHGLASSLEHNDKHVFVWVERSENPYIIAISKADGEQVWKGEGVGKTSWSSPRLVPVGKAEHLVLSGIGRIVGMNPADGKRLWQFDDVSSNSTPTPMPIGKGRFLIGATEGRGESDTSDKKNSNGVIEIKKNESGSFEASYAWRAKKARSSFGSPILAGDNVYFVNRGGVVYCLDSKTGKQVYAQRSEGSVWATPLHVGNRIYLFGKEGTTTVIRAGNEFEVLAKNTLWKDDDEQNEAKKKKRKRGPVLYAVAVSGDRFVFRRGDRVYSVGP